MGTSKYCGKEYLRSNQLRGKRRFCGIDDGIIAQLIDRQSKILVDVLDRLTTRQTIARDDRSWVNLILHKFIRVLQQFGSNDHHRSSAIANLLVLKLSQIYQHFRGRVFHLEQTKNSSSVVGDGNIL